MFYSDVRNIFSWCLFLLLLNKSHAIIYLEEQSTYLDSLTSITIISYSSQNIWVTLFSCLLVPSKDELAPKDISASFQDTHVYKKVIGATVLVVGGALRVDVVFFETTLYFSTQGHDLTENIIDVPLVLTDTSIDTIRGGNEQVRVRYRGLRSPLPFKLMGRGYRYTPFSQILISLPLDK